MPRDVLFRVLGALCSSRPSVEMQVEPLSWTYKHVTGQSSEGRQLLRLAHKSSIDDAMYQFVRNHVHDSVL